MATPTGFSTRLLNVQCGKEVTWGTAVAATARAADLTKATFEANIQTEQYQDVGSLAPANSADVVYSDGKITLEGRYTFEDAPLFHQSMVALVAPTGVGPYVRGPYTAPNSASYTPISYTFEYGITGSVVLYKAAGCLLTELEITFKSKEVWMYKATFACKSVSVLSALAALSDRALTRPRARDTLLYLDAIGGTPGATAVSGFLRDFKLSIKTGIHMKDFVGDVAPSGFGIDSFEGELEMSVELVTATKAELDALLGATLVERFIRVKATRSTQIEQIDFAGYQDGSGQTLFEDNDGNIGLKLKYKGKYDVTQAYWLKFTNTSTVATLPF